MSIKILLFQGILTSKLNTKLVTHFSLEKLLQKKYYFYLLSTYNFNKTMIGRQNLISPRSVQSLTSDCTSIFLKFFFNVRIEECTNAINFNRMNLIKPISTLNRVLNQNQQYNMHTVCCTQESCDEAPEFHPPHVLALFSFIIYHLNT